MVARFQFLPGRSPQRAPTQRWPAEWLPDMPDTLGWSFADHQRDDATGAGWTEYSPGTTAWRLVGPNNRELGRSSRLYPDLASCAAAVEFLREHIGEATTPLAISNDTGNSHAGNNYSGINDSGLWIWRLDIGSQWVAAAGRSYRRRRECLYNLTQFVAAAPTALLSSDVIGRSRIRSAQRANVRWLERAAQPTSTSIPSQPGEATLLPNQANS